MKATLRVELNTADIGFGLNGCYGVLHVGIPQLDWNNNQPSYVSTPLDAQGFYTG